MKRALKMISPIWAQFSPGEGADLWLELRQMLPFGPEAALNAYLNRYEGDIAESW